MGSLGKRAAAAVMAGLVTLTVSAAPALAIGDNYPTVGDQTGTGQTDLTMVIGTGRNSFGGTQDLANPDDDGDGLGDNMAFTVPSAINYVVRADGTLLGPSEGVAHIDNESVFPIEVDHVRFAPMRDFNIVADAKASSRVNAVDLQVGPAQDMLQMSDYVNGRVVGDPTQWRMSAKGTGDGSQVPLKSAGDVANLDVDVTSRTSFGQIQWYVSPAYGLEHGVTVNYELTDTRTNQAYAGQTTLFKLRSDCSPAEDILPQMTIGRMFRLYSLEVDGQSYSGFFWGEMRPSTSSGYGSVEYLDVASLDGKTITVRGSFSSMPEPTTYEHGITVNYQVTDTRTNEVTQGRRVFYDIYEGDSISSSLLPEGVRVSLGNLFDRPRMVLTYDGKEYVGDTWDSLTLVPEPGDEGGDAEFLDVSELDGKTVDVSVTFKSEVPPVEYAQGVTMRYELMNLETNEMRTGELVLHGLVAWNDPVAVVLQNVWFSRVGNASIEYDGDTYVGTTWESMVKEGSAGESLPLEDLDGKTIVLRGSFKENHME